MTADVTLNAEDVRLPPSGLVVRHATDTPPAAQLSD